MKILVTGGAGFIGSHLVDRLIKENHKVVVIDNLSTGTKKNLNPKAKFYKLDIRSPKISDVFKKEKPETVFHLAAQIDLRKSVEDPIEDAKINILGSLNIIQNFIRVLSPNRSHRFASKIIFASTGGAIYGDADIIPTPETYPEMPVSPYGIEKLVFDKYLNYYYKVFGLSYVSLRLSNVYGPRQNSKGEAGVIAIFCDKMLNSKETTINGDGKQTRDFVYINDVVEANILALKKNKIGVFNIGTANETSINTIFRKIRKLADLNCKEIHIPEKPGEQKRSCLDFKKAKKELGCQPKYNLDRGLKETVEWFRNKLAS
ncbi:NAD-dependent epimerase/dehydratase family protein [Candidatus Parcubacteria bacterium]|nr:NAD-dependent epimerase/dehydratase family protein [Candidatus Parcubacteria bacterium]